jgi:hypothetical protein
MTWAVVAGAVIGAGGAYLASENQASAAESAANTSAAASNRAADLQYKMWQEQQALQKPWLEAGQRALPKLEAQYNAMPAAFTGKVTLGQDPGYAFRLAEGNRALNQSAAARGGLISGNALKAAERYGQEMGSQEYGNAYRRALDVYNAGVQRETTGYNRLASLAGIGQTAAGTLGSQAGQYGTNVGNLTMTNAANQGNALMAAGAARSSAYQGYGSALGQAIGGYRWNNLGSGGNSLPYATGDTTTQGPMYQSMLSQGATLNPDGTLSY